MPQVRFFVLSYRRIKDRKGTLIEERSMMGFVFGGTIISITSYVEMLEDNSGKGYSFKASI